MTTTVIVHHSAHDVDVVFLDVNGKKVYTQHLYAKNTSDGDDVATQTSFTLYNSRSLLIKEV